LREGALIYGLPTTGKSFSKKYLLQGELHPKVADTDDWIAELGTTDTDIMTAMCRTYINQGYIVFTNLIDVTRHIIPDLAFTRRMCDIRRLMPQDWAHPRHYSHIRSMHVLEPGCYMLPYVLDWLLDGGAVVGSP